eukprot:403354279
MELNQNFKLEAQEDFLKNLEYLLSVFPGLLDIVRQRSKPVQYMVYNEVVMKLVCDYRSVKCMRKLCEIILRVERANPLFIMSPNEDLRNVWNLIEKMCELNNDIIRLGFRKIFQLKEISHGYHSSIIKRVICRKPNIQNLSNKFDQLFQQLEQRLAQLWRYILPIGQTIYLKEFIELGQDNTQESMIQGTISEVKQIDSYVINYKDNSGINRIELIGRWSQRLCFPQQEHDLIKQWKQNLKVGHRILIIHKQEVPIITTIVDVQHNEQQILEQVKVNFKFYHHNGNKKDKDGRYFLQHVIETNIYYEDEWINIQSQQLLPISTFETYQGNLELVKFLTEEIHSLDFKDPNLPQIQCQNVKDRINLALGTPLYNACENGRLDVAKYLIQFKWQIDYRTYYDVSPLMIALQNDHLDIAEVLIRHGASFNIDSRFSRNQKRKEEMQEKLNIVSYKRQMKILYLKSNPTPNSHINVYHQMSKSVFEKIIKEYC